MARSVRCRECGKPVEAKRNTKAFCCTGCRTAFNNRRIQRGGELYDLFMAVRYDRDKAKELELWTKLCRMAQTFREEDQRERAGRKSWQDPEAVLLNRPDLAILSRTFIR